MHKSIKPTFVELEDPAILVAIASRVHKHVRQLLVPRFKGFEMFPSSSSFH